MDVSWVPFFSVPLSFIEEEERKTMAPLEALGGSSPIQLDARS